MQKPYAGLLLFVIVSAMLCAVAGCGSAAKTPDAGQADPSLVPAPSGPAAPDREPSLLTVCVSAAYYDETRDEPLLRALERFDEQHPFIELQYEPLPIGYNDPSAREAVIKRLNAEIASGRGPDIFILDTFRPTDINLFPNIEKAMRNGSFYDMAAELKNNGIRLEDYAAGIFRAGQYDGAQYVVPLSFNILVALCEESCFSSSGFDPKAAEENTTAFFDETERLGSQHPLNIDFGADLTANMELPLLDYDTGTVNLEHPQTLAMLELERRMRLRSGHRNYVELLNMDCSAFAQNMKQGDPFMMIGLSSSLVSAAWKLAAADAQPYFIAVPNEAGHITASIASYAMVNANTRHPAEAGMLLAWLLGEECQSAAAYTTELVSFPVRKGCTEQSLTAQLENYKNLPWLQDVSPEEAAAYLEPLGKPLPRQTAEQLEASFEQISTAYFHSVWDSSSVQLGMDEQGNPLMGGTKMRWIYGEITMDELLDTLLPRLQLYLNE